MSRAHLVRPERTDDEPAVRAMFVATRRGPLDDAGLDPATVERLLQHQFELQRAGYRLAYPDAGTQLVEVGDAVVGRLIVDERDECVTLVDIMIDPAYQGRGIGSCVLAEVLARAGSRPVELRVDHASPAEAWYHRYGFEQVGADELQAHLVHVPVLTSVAPAGGVRS